MSMTGGGNHKSKVFWGDTNFVEYNVEADGQFHEYTLDLSQQPSWTGMIKSITIQPIDIENSTVVIDWIKLKSKSSGSDKLGDLDTNGIVNIFDFNRLVTYFGNPYTLVDFTNIINNFGK